MEQGKKAIAAMFAATEVEGRAAFLPFFPIGYPTYDESIDAIVAMSEAGVDGFELGIPFSDPLADGPTIQEASQVALEQGVTPSMVLDAVRVLRGRGVTQPILMFSYLNPIVNYGIEQFVLDAKKAGADGFIIPDLPPEEADLFQICEQEGLALVFFLAPTSDTERVKLVAQRATGFIYVVSLTGITGERKALPDDLQDFIARLRRDTDQPLVLGFGISTPEHAQMMTGLVNGFIVGSALVKVAKQDGALGVGKLSQSLRQALG